MVRNFSLYKWTSPLSLWSALLVFIEYCFSPAGAITSNLEMSPQSGGGLSHQMELCHWSWMVTLSCNPRATSSGHPYPGWLTWAHSRAISQLSSHSWALPYPSCFTIELFWLNKVLPYTVSQIGGSCWHWVGSDSLWLTISTMFSLSLYQQ